jgi:hypothetical protein
MNPGKDLVVEGLVVEGFVFEALRPVQLRARDAAAEVFAVERRPPAQSELPTYHAAQEHA